MARVRAVLRRVGWEGKPTSQESLQYRDIKLDSEAFTVHCRGQQLKFARTEFDLLHYFMKNIGRILSHRRILQQVWGSEYGAEPEYLRVYIDRLRRKIEVDYANPQYLMTGHGIGYRFGSG